MSTEQPLPVPGGEPVFPQALEATRGSFALGVYGDEFRALLESRRAIGIERYGRELETHNGRDVIRDLVEELADAYAYATQAALESPRPLRWYMARLAILNAAFEVCTARDAAKGGGR